MRFLRHSSVVAALLAALLPSATPARAASQRGLASYYAAPGERTANGERFDMQRLTAAHRTLPFGTRVRVTNLRNGRHVVVRVNDRGPFVAGRLLDVSYAAARRLGLLETGVAPVSMRVILASRSSD